MFSFGKKKASRCIYASQTGRATPLTEVPDEAFSEKILGDGVAILPSDGIVVAPVDGEIQQIPDTLHAYAIHSDDGLDVLVHIGIDTVQLNGEGFKSFVKTGDHVKAGEKLAEVDLSLLTKKGYALYTPVIITNMDAVKSIKTTLGDTKAGETPIISYTV